MNQNETAGGSTAKCQLTWVHAACSENPCAVVSEMNRSGLNLCFAGHRYGYRAISIISYTSY